MYLWITQRRSPVQVIQKCFCKRNNIYSQYTVLFPLDTNISVSNKFFTNSSITTKKNLLAPYSYMLRKENTERTAVPQLNFSSSNESQLPTETPKLSNKDKLKRAVKDYGATVIIFHVTISLMSLGISYLVISSGVDVAGLLGKVGLDIKNDIAAGASIFVVAYAVHKVFAPVRISITLGATPFIVRYLRRIGILKPPSNREH